jgi:hypothetical protein
MSGGSEYELFEPGLLTQLRTFAGWFLAVQLIIFIVMVLLRLRLF